MKCLIVDDEEISREINRNILSPYFDCHLSTNGIEAVEKYQQSIDCNSPYDLIFMDIEMPLCNGHDALSRIRKLEKASNVPTNKQIKIVMLSSHDDPKSVLDCYLQGGTTYLTKPVSRASLLQVLKNFKMIIES